MAYETLRKPHVKNYVQELLDENGLGIEVRSGLLAQLAHGTTKNKKTLTQHDKSGEIVSIQTIESDVPASVRLRALAHADKIDGTTDKAAAVVRLAEAEYSSLRRKLLKEAGR